MVWRRRCGWLVLVLASMGLMLPVWAQGTVAAPPAVSPPATAAPEKKKPTGPEYLAEGDRLVKEKSYRDALQCYLLAWLEMPDNPMVASHTGDLYVLSGKLAESTKFYASAIKMNQKYEEPVQGMANAYLRLNLPDQAAILLEDPVRVKAFKSTRYLHLLGLANQRIGKYDRAVEVMKAALDQGGEEGGLQGDLGNAYYMLGRYKEADEAYAQALAKSPNDAVAELNRSMAQEKQEKLTEAVASLEQYLVMTKASQDDPQRKRLEDLKAKIAAAPDTKSETKPETKPGKKHR